MRLKLRFMKIEKLLLVVFCILGLIVIAGIILLISYSDRKQKIENESDSLVKQEEQLQTETAEIAETALDDATSILPEFCNLNEAIPEITFTSQDGETWSINDFAGKTTILTFWASWCPDCQEELPMVKDFLEIAQQYGEINYILINKLDNDRETKEKSEQYLSEQGITIGTYYDDGLSAYHMLGLHNIPTTLFLDENGMIRAWCPRQITDVNVFEAYLMNAMEGSGKITTNFVKGNMMDVNGGVHNIYAPTGEATYESEVLSETQGGMLEYALLSRDQELFDKVLSYINSVMRTDGLTSWTVLNNRASDTNALIDDFRIYTALASANELWGGYEKMIRNYEEALLKYAVSHNRYVDFYNKKTKEFTKRFTLCYGDLQAMSMLAAKESDMQEPYDKAVKVVTEGRISEEFPLYYSWYNYRTKEYEKDDLNAAEAMMTLLHLAEVDLLTEETITWLKTQMDLEGVKARYTVEGNIVEGYNYDSTAVYALVAMLAEEIDDMDLRGKALKKMEKMRINNTGYAYNGAFGLEDGSGIISFDQIMAMLAYAYTEN